MNEEYLLQIALELRDEASRNLEAINREMDALKAQMKGIENGAKKTSESMKASFEKVAKASKVMLAGITAAAVGSVKTYADMEKGIKKVETVSSKSFSEIKSSATELATTYGISIGEILEGNYDMASSMGDIAQSQEVLSTAAQLSIAGFTSFGGAINGLSSVMNAYKMEASEATKVSDMLMKVQNNGVTNIDELQSVLSGVIPTAAAMKIEFQDVAAALATMTSNKVPAAQATTQLRSAFAELAKESTSASKEFKSLTGQTFEQFIANSGNVVEAFDLIQKGAEKSGKSLFDVFGSVEAANAVINLTGSNADKFSKNLDEMNKSAGTTREGVEKMSESFNFQIGVLKEKALVGARALGEQLTPKVKELVDWINKLDWKEVFSQENIDSAISWGKIIAGVAGSFWAIEKAVFAVKTAIELKTAAQTAFNVVANANPYILLGSAIIGTVGAITYLQDKGNKEQIAQGKKVAGNLELTKTKLLEIQSILESGGNVTAELGYLEGFDDLKEALVGPNGVESALEIIHKKLAQINNFKIQKSNFSIAGINANTFSKGTFDYNSWAGNGNSGGGKVVNPDGLNKIIDDLNKQVEKSVKFSDIYFKNDKEKISAMQGYYKTALDKMVEAGLTKTAEFEELKKKFFSFDESIKTMGLESFIGSINDELKNISNIWEILGVNESGENELKEMEKALEGSIKEAVTNGFTDAIPDLQKKLEDVRFNLNLFEENRKQDELDKTAYEQKQQEIKAAIKAEENARKESEEGLRNLGQTLYQAAELVKSESLKLAAALVNSISAFQTAINNLSKSLNGGNFDFLGKLGKAAEIVGDVIGAVQAGMQMAEMVAVGVFGGKTSASIAKKNDEQKNIYQQNTDALVKLGEVLIANTLRLEDFSLSLINNIAKKPTIYRIDSGNLVFNKMIDAMMSDKDFGKVSALQEGSKRNWYGKKKTTWTNVDISEDKLMEAAGIEKKDIDEMSLEELINYREKLNNVTIDMLSSNLKDSNLDEYKKNLDTFIKQIEMLNKEQDELFRSATLGNFEGIDFLEEKQLIKEYTEMFQDLGLEVDEYTDVIKEMAEANKILITSIDDVRASMIENIISGEGSFSSSMGSYFQKIFKNMASVIYDVTFSEIDEYFSDAFKTISEKLVDLKKEGGDMIGGMTDLITSFDFSKILEADKINVEFNKVVDAMREQLENMGLSTDLINSLLPTTALSEKIESLRNMLSSAMKSALDVMDFDVFNKSLGQSLYENVKSGLIQAFTETELYKGLMKKFMPDMEDMFSGATSFEGAFDIMKDYLNKFEKELEAAGMGFVNNTKTEAEDDKTLGNSFYNDTNKISIVIEQNFNGSFVGDYDFRRLAKDGAVDALKEMKEEVKLVGGF